MYGSDPNAVFPNKKSLCFIKTVITPNIIGGYTDGIAFIATPNGYFITRDAPCSGMSLIRRINR